MMKQNGISFRHAVELLRDGAGSEGIPSLAAGGQPVKRSTVKVLEAPLAFDADEYGRTADEGRKADSER